MKTIFICLAFLLFWQSTLSAQDLLPSAARLPLTNSNGDPLTNILDADGFQQGDWFYTDIYDNNLVRKHYEDNICTNTYYLYNGSWVNASNWEQNLNLIDILKAEVISYLSKNQVGFNLSSNQQLALLFDVNGRLVHIAPIGDWDSTLANQLVSQIQTILGNTSLNSIQHETFILF